VGSSVGPRWGQGPGGGFGHLGFTGCALWVDVTRGLSASLLTNRVLHGREHTEGIKALRPEFFDGVIETYPG
jgi:CubicO group peptidase (beta-lactamase class C family)